MSYLKSARIWVIAAVAAAMVGAFLNLIGADDPLTLSLTLVFLLLAPAACVADLLPGLDPAGRAVVAGGASVVILTTVAEIMLNTSHWSTRGGVVATAIVCTILMVIARLRRRRRADALATYMPGPLNDSDTSRAPGDEEDGWAFEP
jgi:uncharacterized membrane protein